MSASTDSSDNISPPPSEAIDTSPSSPAPSSSPPPPDTPSTPPTPSLKTNKRKTPTSKPRTPKKPAKSGATASASWAPEHERFILASKAAGKPVAQITRELNGAFTIDRTKTAVVRKLQNLGLKNYEWTTKLEDVLKEVVKEYKAANAYHAVAGMFRGKGTETAAVKVEAIQLKLKAMEAEGVIEKLQ